MSRIFKTLGFIAKETIPSMHGMMRQWDWPLIKARVGYTFTRQCQPFVAKTGIPIQNTSRLIAYWGMAYVPGFLEGWPDLVKADSPLIVDIGANYGMFGSLMRVRFPKATIIGFEPFPDAVKFLHGLGVYDQIHQTALGKEPGNIVLHFRDNDGFTGTTNAAFAGETGGYPGTLQVGITKLDDFQLAPDLLKCDVDGAETEVLSGGIETFRRTKVVLMECEREEDLVSVSKLLQKTPKKVKASDYLFV